MSHVLKPALLMLVISILVACGSSPEKQKARAEAKYTEEKTKTMQEYKSCIKKAGENEEKVAICERLLKAVEVQQ